MGSAIRSVQTAGALETILSLCVAYAGERVAFERPIGKFQAVQQNLARLAGEVAAALAVSGSAADAIAQAGSFDEAYVLEGSVRKGGNRVRVTGQLIDAESGAHLWADRFDRDLTDIFAVQDELTQVIISALKVKLTPEKKGRLARKGKIDVEAYNLFLRGRERMWLHTRSGNVEARTMLGSAIAINPVFAAAHACIAVTHVNDYINGWAEIPERSLQSGLEIAARAILMDDEDPHAHGWFAVALLWHREHDRALAGGAALPRLSAKFGRRTCGNGPYSDMQR